MAGGDAGTVGGVPIDEGATKGRRKRCSENPYVGGIPTLAGELVWRLAGGVVERVRSRHQLDGTETLVVTTGEVPEAHHFEVGAVLGEGWWSAPADASSMTRSGQRDGRAGLGELLWAHPELAERAGAAVSGVRLRTDALGGADEATVAATAALSAEVAAAGGRALVVGGAVRDALLGEGQSSDVDVEVFGLEACAVEAICSRLGAVKATGNQFVVFKIAGCDLDVALPRLETKTGSGHLGFEASVDPHLSVERAAQRRDFTMNAISWDPLTGDVVDPVGGAADLAAGVLRAVGPAFGEDPLRVLRGAQFVSRFDLVADPATVSVCRSLVDSCAELSRERVVGEWSKLLGGRRPGRGLEFLDQTEWVVNFEPLSALRGVAQDPRWHPEGDVFVHTGFVLDELSSRYRGVLEPSDYEIVALAALCHDLGKAGTTELFEGRWRAHGHEAAGAAPSRALLGAIGPRRGIEDQVVALVEHHLAPVQLHAAGAGDAAVRRLARKVERIDLLVALSEADVAGRPPKVLEHFEAGEWLLGRARELSVERAPMPPLVGGRDLIGLGMSPGPGFRPVLDAVARAAEEGTVTDAGGALAHAAEVARRLGLL